MARKKLKKIIKKSPFHQAAGGRSGAEAERIKKTKIRVVGIGGGGGSIVSEIASKIKEASFLVANTDRQALRGAARKAIRFQFGQSFTKGLGTGMNVELGEMAAQSEKDKIKKLLEGQDLCIIIACLGGGIGSGAAPIFAKISKDLGNLTYGIFTLPFKFEGEKKMEIAKNSLEKLKPKLNVLSLIPNERIFQIIDKQTPLRGALSAINKNLTESLEGLIETIYQPGLINIDFADLKTILEGKGRLAYLNTVEVQKKGNSAKEAIEKVLNNPLYPYGIRGAKGVLFNIAGEKNLELSEIGQISRTISELAHKEAKIIFGISQNKKYANIIKTTLLATGCGAKVFPAKPRKPWKKKALPKLLQLAPIRLPLPAVKKRTPELKKKTKVKEIKNPKLKKRKIKVQKELKTTPQLKVEEKQIPVSDSSNEKVKLQSFSSHPKKEIYRKNALQIKKEAEAMEEEMIAKEKFWETPAFLRRGTQKS